MKTRKKYKFHLVRKDTGGIIFSSKRTFRNEKFCFKNACWFAMYYGFTQQHVSIWIEKL